DYFSQSRMYWNSLTTVEQKDLLETLSFHLQKVQSESVRQQNVDMFVNVDKEFAIALAENIGVEPPKGSHVSVEESSDAVSIDKNMPASPYTKKVAVLIGNEFDDKEVDKALTTLKEKGVFVHLISEQLGEVTGKKGMKVSVTDTLLTTHPTLFDSLYVIGGKSKNQEMFDNHVKEFLNSHYKFFKP